MKNSKNITISEFKNMLLNWNHGAQPASVQYITTPTLNKDGKAKFGEVTKIANIGCMIGYKYENSVNKQRERENELKDFMSKPLWKGKGKRLTTAISTHIEKGTFYLTYKKQQTFKSFHFDTALNFIPARLLKPFYPKSDPAKYQGIDKPVYHREILLENVRKVKFMKTTYNIIPD